MGDWEPRPRTVSLTEADLALRWVGIDYEGGRDVADEQLGTNTWVSQDPDGGLLQSLMFLKEAVRRLQAIETYCSSGTSTEVTKDVVAMAKTGGWHPAGKP